MWNERRLARRAARGDPDAFASIFRHYEQDLYRYCVAILGDRQDAQDALQNTMVKALAALPGERREIELRPWLYRVAHNESVELRRRQRPLEPLEDGLPAPGAGLEQTAGDRARLRELLADIGRLPERQRGALVMRELAGLDFAAIATALDTTPQAARQVLYEARRGLQQMKAGREMECDAVTALLSEQDGRAGRRRDIRAHLRDCPECRHFAEAIRTRSRTLASISPLPALAAAAIVKGAVGGSGAAGAAGGGASTGAAGLAGGAAVKAATTGAILKSAAGIVAVVAVSAVAVDHAQLFQGGGPSAGAARGQATVATGAATVADPAARRTPADGGSGASAAPQAGKAQRLEKRARDTDAKGTGAREAALLAGAHVAAKNATAVAHGAPTESPGATRASAAAEAPATQRAHPTHPTHPEHARGRASSAHPGHPHPSHPSHPPRPARPPRPEPPARPAQAPHPEATARPETTSSQTPPAAPEPASVPVQPPETSAPVVTPEPPGRSGR
ncbi:MAG: sigma-70 family RNA polymerase sigma factor [Actinobacteria bacterium]|nr:sigma-70 family RNA polymerase sigma factor [Actinomycetota bacterium]